MTERAERAAIDRLIRARRGEDWSAVLNVLGSSWSELYQDHPTELLEALKTMPEQLLDREPRLRLARQHISRTLSGDRKTRAYLDILRPDDDASPIDRLAALTGQIAAARSAGRHDDAVSKAEQAIAYLRTLPVETIPSLSNALPEFHYHWGVTFAHSGRFSDALNQFTESYDWASSIGHRMMMTSSGGGAAFIHALHGRGREAAAWLARLPPILDTDWWSAFAGAPALIADALLHNDRLDIDAAALIIARIDISQSIDYWGPYFVVKTLITSARDSGAQTLLAEFDTFLESLPPGNADTPANVSYTAIVRYLLLLSLGQPIRALRELDPDAPNAEASVIQQIGATLHARRLVRLGQGAAARKLVAPLTAVLSSRPRVLIRALTIAAETDTRDQSHDLLRRAMELANWHEHYSGFAQSPAIVRNQVADQLEALGNVDVASRLRALPEQRTVPGAEALTRRESMVVELALAGLSNAQISRRLRVSPNTIKTQLRSAYRKLGVTSREELQRHFHFGR
jgi:DNA-binding CsgD family transcriptional regulator